MTRTEGVDNPTIVQYLEADRINRGGDVARTTRLRHQLLVAGAIGLTATLAAACGQTPTTYPREGSEPNRPAIRPIDLKASAKDQVMLLANQDTTLVIDVTPSQINVVVAEGHPTGQPTLPPGFTPTAARSTADSFMLQGNQCSNEGDCNVAIYRSRSKELDWERITVPGDLSSPSMVDPGDDAGRFYIATGSLGGPAIAELEDDGSWKRIAWPDDIGGSPLSSCSTLGTVYLFGQQTPSDEPLSGNVLSSNSDRPEEADETDGFVIYALDQGQKWQKVRTADLWPNPSADPILCSAGGLTLPTIEGPSTRVSFTGDHFDVTKVPLPPLRAQPHADQPYPRAALSARPDTSAITGEAHPYPGAPSEVALLSATEDPKTLWLVVEGSRGDSIELVRWARN